MNVYFSFSDILMWAEGIWGILTVLFWAITYILIVLAGILSKKEKQVSMPYVAGVLNVAWEIAATIHTKGNPCFIVWFGIDVLIVVYGIFFLSSIKKKIFYCTSILLMTVLLLYSFRQYTAAFIFTVYLIDVIMAVNFVLKRKVLSKKFKVTIAATKLIGDIFAGLAFSHKYGFVKWFAIISFICNFVYLIQCIKESTYFKRGCFQKIGFTKDN